MLRCYAVTLRPTMWHTGTCGHGSCSTLVSNVIKVDSENIAKHAISALKTHFRWPFRSCYLQQQCQITLTCEHRC